MKTINWKIANAAFWLEIILAYLLPFKVTDNFQYQAGFPIPFLSVYAAEPGVSPFMSMHLNPLGLLFNGVILYWLITAGIRVWQKVKGFPPAPKHFP